mmetsp:Transcript_151741/g.279749  ORF Transcript_151741/g.279749 Transcript_151741/m.279749 type:complete len:266 (-) Transcript_151741:241-1038(-)
MGLRILTLAALAVLLKHVVASGACTGAPCQLSDDHCRSHWGWCGSSSAYCNSKSTWTSACGSQAPTTTAAGFLSATTTTTTTITVNVDAPSTTTVSRGGEGTWTSWNGDGVTCHTTDDYEVATLCADNHDMIHACWYIDDAWVANESPCQDDFTCEQAQVFQTNSVLSNFCARTDHIAFGHPVDALCGECVELRVQRADGKYNTVTVMQVDIPKQGRLNHQYDTSSPEVSRAAKTMLTQGVVLPDGRQAEFLDRLPFEYRPVPCI